MDRNLSADNSEAVDIGGLSVQRAALAEMLTDPERFERHRADALAVDAAMRNNNGAIPEYVNEWPAERIQAVIATLKELGQLRAEAQQQIKSTQTDASAESAERPVSQLFRHGGRE